MKEVINSILASNIANDHYGAYKLLLDNRYACPDLFVILFEEKKLIGYGNCITKRIGFPGDDVRLTFSKRYR